MFVEDLAKIALRQVFRNRRRYRGALIGTTLGIAGLITVMTVGDSVQDLLGLNLEILGSATMVKAQWQHRAADNWHSGEYSMKDVADLRKVPIAHQVAPTVWMTPLTATHLRNKKLNVRLGGLEPSFFRVVHLPVTKGRGITDDDVEQRRHICLIGDKVEKALFQDGEPGIGKIITVEGVNFEVVGVMGAVEEAEFQDTILVPITVARSKIPGMWPIRHIYIRAKNWDLVPQLHEETVRILKANHPGYADSMLIVYFKERIDAIQKIAFLFKFFLYAAIVVTLILGGLGITNIMLALVKERTTEIGLCKAVGATERAIVQQFVCESLSVSLAGAAAGIVFGLISVEILKRVLATSPSYEVFALSVLAGVVVGLFLGVASGAIPARAAGKLDPVEAMRFE